MPSEPSPRDGDRVASEGRPGSDRPPVSDRRVVTDGGDRDSTPDPLEVAPGDQVLLVTGSMSGPLAHLPEWAFANLLLLTVRAPARVERTVERRGFDPDTVGVVPITGLSVDYDGPMWCADAVAPNDLTGISIGFARGMRHVTDGEGWVALDNLSTLMMYAADDRLHRLVSHIVLECRERNVCGVHAVVGDSVTDQTLAQFAGTCDRLVDRGDDD